MLRDDTSGWSVRVESLSCTLRKLDKCIIEGVSFEITDGDRIALIGEPGSGKSTLMRAVLGLLDPSVWVVRGSVIIEKNGSRTDYLALGQHEMQRYRGSVFRCLFQEPSLSINPAIRFKNQLRQFVSIQETLDEKELKKSVHRVLSYVDMQDREHIYNDYPVRMSGGQRQRFGVALALAKQARVLFLDEITSYLDTALAVEVIERIKQLHDNKIVRSIFSISHDLYFIKILECNKVYSLQNGKIISRSLDDVGDLIYDTRVTDEKTSTISLSREVPVVKVDAVSASYERRRISSNERLPIFSPLSFEMFQGDSLGIVGDSGSGKTTLGMCVAGMHAPDGGSVTVNGVDILGQRRSNPAVAARSVGVIFQDAAEGYDYLIDVRSSIDEGLVDVLGAWSNYETRLLGLLDRFSLGRNILSQFPDSLSGGEKQIIAIIKTLLINPDVLIADEPFTHLDRKRCQVVCELFRERLRTGGAMILISHDLGRLTPLCNGFVVMMEGRGVVGRYTRDEIRAVDGLDDAASRLYRAAEKLGCVL